MKTKVHGLLRPLASLLAPVFFVLFPGPALGDHPSVSFIQGTAGPVVTVSAIPLPPKTLLFDLRLEAVEFDGPADSELEGEGVHSVERLLSTSVGVAYGATADLTVGLRLPYLRREGIRERHHHEEGDSAEAEIADLGDSEGIGDLTLYGEYRFLHRPQDGVHAALLFGLKTPTGVDDRRSEEGTPFEAEHQPGSGSWDPMLGLAATRHLGSLCYDANVLYVLATEGTRDTDLGDRFLYNAAVSWRIPGSDHPHAGGETHGHPAWDLVLEANGEYREKEKAGGETDRHTGGHLLYLSPGLRFSAGGLSASLSAGIPVLVDLNGTQSEPDLRPIVTLGAAF